jgi:DNA helicase-2/ATP-dependent DNA helicase PcrA
MENLAELVEVTTHFPDLATLLETISLVAATDDLDDSGGRVSLMTLHAAKGLEFKVVFLTGLEEGIFPHDRALSDPEELEEERRLCYVGITRARERLYLTHTWVRTLYGQSRDAILSRFLKEIPDELIDDVADPYGVPRQQLFPPTRSESLEARVSRLSLTKSAQVGTGAETLGLEPGDKVEHARWGAGTIVEVSGDGDRAAAIIAFPRHGKKKFLLQMTPLKKV